MGRCGALQACRNVINHGQEKLIRGAKGGSAMKIPQALSSDGKRIGKDCQGCHSILSGEAEGVFEHPVDIGD